MSEIERVVEKAKQEGEVEQIIPANPLLIYFQKADEILRLILSAKKNRKNQKWKPLKKNK